MRTLLVLLFLLALGAGLYAAFAPSGNRQAGAIPEELISDPPIIGAVSQYRPQLPPAVAPEVSFRAADGATLSLDDFEGEMILLNFWATWCGPCRTEMPSLDRVQSKFSGRPFRVVAISSDRNGLEAVAPFFEEQDIAQLEVYLDPDNSVGRAFGVGGLPTTVFIGPSGRVLGRMVAPAEWDEPEALSLIEYYLEKIEAAE